MSANGWKSVSLPANVVEMIDEHIEDNPRWSSRAEFLKHTAIEEIGAAR